MVAESLVYFCACGGGDVLFFESHLPELGCVSEMERSVEEESIPAHLLLRALALLG